MTVAVDNLYVVRNGNGTLDTIRSGDPRMAKWVLSSAGYEHQPRGGIAEVTQVSVIEKLELDSTKLKLPYLSPN